MTPERLEKIIGPRLPEREIRSRPLRFLLPSLLLGLAAMLLIASIPMPYWILRLDAPQYPKGLRVQAYLNKLEGDVREIDGLNHYIGMRPLNQAAQLERTLSILVVTVTSLLVIAAIYIHNKYAALLSLPALLFPALFLLDLQYWLADFGTDLDPTAPLSSSIKPFVPPVLGEGTVGQFATVAWPGPGLLLATAASLLILAGLVFHRRAYKPLVEAVEQRGA